MAARPTAPAGRTDAGGQASQQARSGQGEGGDAGRPAPARACPGPTSFGAGASASPSCASSTRAGPTCRTQPSLPRSTNGWRRSSTVRLGASTSPPRSRRWCRGTSQRQLDALAPTHIEVPSGSRVPVDYGNPAEPTLSVRLQEMFGLTDTPRLAGGKVPVTDPPALAGPPAGAGDPRPGELLEERLSRREGRAQGPLSQALLARRPADRRADRPRQAATMSCRNCKNRAGRDFRQCLAARQSRHMMRLCPRRSEDLRQFWL